MRFLSKNARFLFTARCLSWIRFHHSANVPFYFIILKISQESEKSIKINRELMNGLGYGRFNGLSGSRNSLREFSNNYYGRRKSDYYQLMTNVDRNTSGYDDSFLSVPTININEASKARPHSTGSYMIHSNRHLNYPAQNFRSNNNIIQPLTKQVDQLLYEIPDNKFTKNALCQPPEFLKVFSNIHSVEGGKAIFDCVLLGSPRPRVCWLFNDEKMNFNDVQIEDTADICRCTINCVRPYHYGVYTVLAENEVGRAITTATLFPSF